MQKKDEVHYTDTNICSYIRHIHDGEKFTNDNVEHYHDDLEFTVCLRGSYQVEFDNQTYIINEGDGVFINSLVKHKVTTSNSEVIYVKCHPMLLHTNEYIWRTYIAPLNSNQKFKYVLLHSSIEWENRILDLIIQMNHYKEENNNSSAIFMQTSLLEIWQLFYENYFDKSTKQIEDSKSILVNQMITFIQNNYQKNIAISDVASAVNISISSCNHLFKQYMHITPNAYLIDCRLRKAKQLLEDTDLNITEIAIQSGFSASSYFSESFKKQYHQTPKEFRYNMKK